MKKTLALFLCLAMLAAIFPASALSASAETCGDYDYYVTDESAKTCVITSYGAGGDVVIPSELNGYKVTEIGWEAFYGYASLESVTIPNSVTEIGSEAFRNCTSLTAINVAPANKEYTSKNGVLFTKDMKTLLEYPAGKPETAYVIPNSVTYIGYKAFCGCASLASITIPNSVTNIGDHAFCECTSLTSVTIPNSVTNIGDHAFQSCTSLASITIGNSVTSIGEYAFAGCSSLTSIKIPDSVTYIGGDAFWGCFFLKSVTIGNSVTSIGVDAFEDCSSLMSIKIPDSVTSIDEGAFGECTSLTSVTIGNSVTTIGEFVFSGCPFLTAINVDPANKAYTSKNGVLFTKDMKTLLTYPVGKPETAYVIPNSVTSIGVGAFCDRSSLTSITIGNSVTSIGEGAFFGCSSLADVYYTGSKEQWKAIGISEYNEPLLNAEIHFNYVPVIGKGDATEDGIIDSLDAALIMQYDTGVVTNLSAKLADVNGDGEIDNLDSAIILQYDAGLISSIDGEPKSSSTGTNYAAKATYTVTKNGEYEPARVYLNYNQGRFDWADIDPANPEHQFFKMNDGKVGNIASYAGTGEGYESQAAALAGTTVKYFGTDAAFEFLFDLGDHYDDIKSLKFRNVRHGTPNGNNRGFEVKLVQASDDGVDWHRVKGELTSVQVAGAPEIESKLEEGAKNVEHFDFTYTFDEPVQAKNLKIILSTDGGFVLQLEEIEIRN